jgi:hypothetical protein
MARRRPNEPTANPARGAILVIAAVVVGLVLLRNGLDTSETFTPSTTDGSASDDGGASDLGATDSSTNTTEATTARPPQQVATIVLNDSGVSGAAGNYSDFLANLGYTLTNPDGDTSTLPGDAPTTQVLYQPGYQLEAQVVAAAIGAPATGVGALGTTLPGTVSGANVVVVLGTDLASTTPTAPAG